MRVSAVPSPWEAVAACNLVTANVEGRDEARTLRGGRHQVAERPGLALLDVDVQSGISVEHCLRAHIELQLNQSGIHRRHYRGGVTGNGAGWSATSTSNIQRTKGIA